MKDYPDGMFKPEGGITRAELAAILSCVLPQQEQVGAAANYADVPDTYWAARSIATVSAQTWMLGYGDGDFQPERQVTRSELAQVLFNISETDSNDAVRFADAAQHWAAAAIAAVDVIIEKTLGVLPSWCRAQGSLILLRPSGPEQVKEEGER